MHQKGNNEVIKGNWRADAAARGSFKKKNPKIEGPLIPERCLDLTPPQYTEKEDQLAEQLDCTKIEQGWWMTPLKQLLIPKRTMEFVLKKLHQETYMGSDALVLVAKKYVIGPKMQSLADIVVKKCPVCCANNTKIEKKTPEEI